MDPNGWIYVWFLPDILLFTTPILLKKNHLGQGLPGHFKHGVFKGL